MNGDNIVWGTKFGSVSDSIESIFDSIFELLNVVWGV